MNFYQQPLRVNRARLEAWSPLSFVESKVKFDADITIKKNVM